MTVSYTHLGKECIRYPQLYQHTSPKGKRLPVSYTHLLNINRLYNEYLLPFPLQEMVKE